MVKRELSLNEISESIADLWTPLNEEQRTILAKEFTIQRFKKNEIIYCQRYTFLRKETIFTKN